MTGIWLYARSRQLVGATALLIAVQVAGAAIGTTTFRVSQYSETAVPWLVFLPLLSAIIIGVSMRSAASEIDATAHRRLVYWRAAHVAALALVSLVGLVLLTATLSGPIGALAGIRNFAGFLGLALLSGFLFGGRMAWVLPIVSALPAMTFGNPAGNGIPWDWAVRTDDNFGAFAVGTLALLAGLATLGTGTREARGDVAA